MIFGGLESSPLLNRLRPSAQCWLQWLPWRTGGGCHGFRLPIPAGSSSFLINPHHSWWLLWLRVRCSRWEVNWLSLQEAWWQTQDFTARRTMLEEVWSWIERYQPLVFWTRAHSYLYFLDIFRFGLLRILSRLWRLAGNRLYWCKWCRVQIILVFAVSSMWIHVVLCEISAEQHDSTLMNIFRGTFNVAALKQTQTAQKALLLSRFCSAFDDLVAYHTGFKRYDQNDLHLKHSWRWRFYILSVFSNSIDMSKDLRFFR